MKQVRKFGTAVAILLACLAGPAQAAERAIVVELFTSQGCSSCPPAEQVLLELDGKGDEVLALGFHVDYWDRLGWKDRFASAAFTQRQAQQQPSNGARFSYTPQVVVDGRDRTDWSSVAVSGAARAVAPVDVALSREGDQVVARVAAGANAPKSLAAFWAVTEHGHVSPVKSGENEGVTLHHDYVVRDYEPVAPWAAKGGAPQRLVFAPRRAADAAHPRTVNLVIVDAATGRPVQAAKLAC